MAKLLDLSVYGPGHISNILQVDASVYAKAFVTDGGKDTQVVRGDGTLASISSLSVGNADTVDNMHASDFATAGHTHNYLPFYQLSSADCNSMSQGLTAVTAVASNQNAGNHSAFLTITNIGTPFQLQIPDSDEAYIYKRYRSGSSWSAWSKLSAGYADSAGSVDWSGITGKPEFTYGLNNLCSGVSSPGGQTTKLDDWTIQTSGNNSDTYFTLGTIEPIDPNQEYTLGFYVEGYPGSGIWSWPVGSQNNGSWTVNINRNGWCWGTGKYPSANGTSTGLFMDDSYRGFFNSIKMKWFTLVKGKLFPYFNYPSYNEKYQQTKISSYTILHSNNYTDYVNTTNFPGLNKTGTVTSITVQGSNGISGSGTVTTSGTIILSASYLPTCYIGGQKTNPQTYFSNTIGLRVAMTGSWSVWSDTLWINGYSGEDVKSMCALHFLRNGTPRMAISCQNHDATSYGTYYEVITAYNISSQHVSYADSAGSVAWGNVTGKPINFKAYSGSLSSGGWKTMQGKSSSPSIAISYNNSAASWNSGTYSATLVYGCADTRGLLDCAYNIPIVTFGGCSYGDSDDNNPTWYMKLSGTNGTTYNLNSMPYASSAGIASTVTVNNSGSNSTYRMVWHSDNTLYSTDGIYCNPSTDVLNAKAYTLNGASSTGTNYITGTTGRIFFGGNFHIDSLGSNATYINHYTANNVYLVSGSSQGNVGIGTQSPSYKLDVNGNIHGSHFYMGGYLYMKFGGSWLSTIDNDGDGPIFGHALAYNNRRVYYVGSPVYICGGGYGNYENGITVNSSNNVGIGTSSPSQKLHVSGGIIQVNANSRYLQIGPQNSGWSHFQSDVSFYFNQSLHVDGDIYLYNTSVRMQKSNGYVYASGFYHNSYASSAYALTSDGGAAHIGSMSVNYANSAGNADTIDGYHADDILPYGLENLCIGAVKSGGQTTLNSDGSITTSGNNSDTYFFVRCTEKLIAGQIYTVGFYVTGVPSGNAGTWNWPFAGQSNSNLVISIQRNGWCWGTGTIPNDIALGTDIIFDDARRDFYNSINISKFVIVKGRQKAYYTPPISKMSVNYASSAGSVAWGNVTGKPSTFSPSSHTHDYLPLSGGVMTGSPYIYFPSSVNNTNLTDNTPTGLTYGRLQSYGTMTICGDTDGSATEYVNITAGYSIANATAANGLSIGYSTLKWKGNTIWHAGNDGSGSGLDADTVDGENASAFAHIGAHNNLTASGNEFTFASSGFSGTIWFNYRTAGGTNGNITEYRFGNGKGGELGTAIHSGNIGSYALPITGGTCTGNIYASAFYETSDERLKDFENDVNVDLNLIRYIPKMYFRWKKNPNKLQIGTSAQAVKKIYPELVTSSEDGMLSVDYSKLSIVALSAIDKLHLENQGLKHEINLLKKEIEKLKGQI